MERIDDNTEEVIIATNPSTSGNATAMYVEKILKDKKITISRLAVGLPVGSNLEYIDHLEALVDFKTKELIDGSWKEETIKTYFFLLLQKRINDFATGVPINNVF
mgnify:CR=1 FL=1